MASFTSQALFISFFTFFSAFLITTNGQFSSESVITTSTKRMEKTTRLHFYFHDNVSGKNPTAVKITRPHNKSAGSFGTAYMADDPLTEKAESSSKLVGRAQGIYASASQHDAGLLMVMNFAFSEGTYNGSTLSILGRNEIFHTVREIPVVGGTGIFRFARGYALAKTVWYSIQDGNAVVEYNVSVVHY
ncbi:hypothetical protein HRI_004855700 [Hibiscus trionum]|uniref:Dirigent protein n=1 Tax=Hibiscus trionum TaxID=183268 RepID=A0A9W7JDP0_HIBTR|nr:hypothetical protein HRI_004855700 [Hibiscus trionum]